MVPIIIPRRNRMCLACKEQFTPGSEYISVLLEESKENLVRNDYCHQCWEKHPVEELKSFWKAIIPDRKSIAKDPEGHFEEVLEFLREEIDKDTEESRRYAYILALYMVRKKQLAFRQEIDIDGISAHIYEVLKTEEMLCVKKVSLSPNEMQEIQETLISKFQQQNG